MKPTMENKRKSPLYVLITAITVVVLAAAAIVLPRLMSSDAGKNPDGTHGGVLRNPTVTEGMTEGTDTPPVTVFAPSVGDFRLSVPEGSDGAVYAVPTAASVYLTSEQSFTAETLSEALRVTPPTPISVTASGEGFLVTPMSGTWNGDTLYRLSLEGEQGYLGAFQTVRDFAVDAVYPGHEATDVPTDTGIEITFTDTVRNTDLASYITVSPAIDGKFEIYPSGRTVVIVPDEPLEKETVYTVTVKAGMPSDNGTTLEEGRVFGFLTMHTTLAQSEIELVFSAGNELLTAPGEEASLRYNARLSAYYNDPSMTALAVTAKIYAIPSADQLMAMMEDGISARGDMLFAQDIALPTDGLKSVFAGDLETYAEYKWDTTENGWLYLPRLDEGIYLVELCAKTEIDGTPSEDTMQVLWQVTPLRAYTESVFTDTASDTLVWSHRTDTGDIAAETAISAVLFENTLWYEDGEIPAPKTQEIKTDKNGLARLTGDSDADMALLQLTHDGHSLVLCTSLANDAQGETVRAHLYTDRAVYFANDTVHFHGFLGRTYPGQILPDTLSLNVAGNDTGVTVSVADDGTFIGSFPIEDWIGTRISMTLTDDGGTVNLYRSLTVTQQEKPLYTLEISYDRPFYTLENQTAVVTMQLSYFDGTPAPGMTLSVYTAAKQQTVTTDEAGLATFTYRMPEMSFSTTYPHQDYVSVQLSGYETVSLYREKQTVYFHSSGVMSSRRVNNDYSLLTLHTLDTSRITAPEDYYAKAPYYPEILQGAPMNATVSVKLEKQYYIKQKSGQTYYDPISKVTVDYYDYIPKTDVIKTYQAQVTNGELRLDHIDARGEECSYYYIVSWIDPVCGRTYTERIRANRSSYDYDPYGDNTPVYSLSANTDAALPGEEIVLTLTFDDEPAALKGNNVLYTRTTALDGRCGITAGNANSYRYTFDEACTLGSAVNVTVFDGRQYVTHLSHTAYYDEVRGSNAELTVTADRDTYKPGETAQITVTAPDLAGGTVLVSVVDEACFALGEHTVSTSDYFLFANTSRYWGWGGSRFYLPQILRDDRHSLLSVLRMMPVYRYSDDLKVEMEEAPMEDAADKNAAATGGSAAQDPVYIREQFSNTAAFVQVHLDENGSGTATITVPDNITTWRLTAVGFSGTGELGGEDFTSGVRCGTDISDAVCTLPFFLNVTIPDLILTSDEVAFSARTAGTLRATDPTAQVSYTAVLYDETGKELGTAQTTAAANETAWFSFDALPAGDYSVVVTGRCGNASDGVRAAFRVVETAQIVRTQKTLSPAELSALKPAAYPLTLTFFDATDSLYLETLSALSSYNARRTDSMAAAFAALTAEEALLGNTRTWYSPANAADAIRRDIANNYWSYLPVTRYGEGDPILTAKVLYAAPDLLSEEHKSRLAAEYESLLLQKGISGETTAAALLALASLDRPVLDLLYNTAPHVHGMTDTEILCLAAAFSAAGDIPAASALWEPLRNEWGQEEDGDAFCIVGENTEDTIRLTALALLPASAVDADTACKMVRYLQNHTSSVELYDIETAAFLTHYTPKSADETVLSYTNRTGEEVSVTLKRGQSHTVTLTKSDFAALKITSADEGMTVRASYGASPADAMMERDNTLTLHKTITPYDAKNGIYRVTITYEGKSDADHLSYALSDTVPAGARFFIDEPRYNASWNDYTSAYLSNDGGQQMKGNISVWNPTLYDKDRLDGTQAYSFSGSVSYLIRGAVKGTFTAEPAMALNYEYGTYALTGSHTVDILDGAWNIK